MDIDIRETDNTLTITLQGRMDTPAAVKAQADFTNLYEKAGKSIIIDCTHLQYISSSGLRLLLLLRKEAENKGGKVTVVNINDDIQNVFKITGFLNLFEIKNT